VRHFSCVGIGAGQANRSPAALIHRYRDIANLFVDKKKRFGWHLRKSRRLYHYRNAQFDAVPRQDFRNYMEWACLKNENIMFDREMLSVEYPDVFYVHLRGERLTSDNIGGEIGIRPPGPDHDDGPLMLLAQPQWSIVVARERKQGSARVQDGVGGVHGAAGWVRGTASRRGHPSSRWTVPQESTREG
jgi:L-lysine 6-monooxygenase (NADPH-requiring)